MENMLSSGVWLNPKELGQDADLDFIRTSEMFQKFMLTSKKKFEGFQKHSQPNLIPVNASDNKERYCFWIPGKGTNYAVFQLPCARA